MPAWVPPTVGYIVTLGLVGVTAKLALKTVTWQQLVLFMPFAYGAFLIVAAAAGSVDFPRFGAGFGWTVLTAALAAVALILFYVALTKGPASTVVPVAAAYPLVTVVLSAIFLSERVTPLRIAGTIVVIAGVGMLSR